MNHRIKFLLLLCVLAAFILLPGLACTEAGVDVGNGVDLNFGDAMGISDALDAAREYGESGGGK